MPDLEPRDHVGIETLDDLRIVEESDGTIALQTEHGYLLAQHQPGIGMFSIGRVDVEPDFRGKGIGKGLLRAAADVARERGAIELYASIESRESIDAFTSVFGEGSVNVIQLGTYAPADDPQFHDANAVLLHRL